MPLVHVLQSIQCLAPLTRQVMDLENGVVVNRSAAELRPALQHDRFLGPEMQRLRGYLDRSHVEFAGHRDERFRFLGGRDQARQHRTVVVAVDQIQIGGQAQRAGPIAVAHQLFHLFEFRRSYFGPPRVFFAEYPGPDRRLRDVGRDIDADAGTFERLEIFALTDPVPAHTLFHGIVGDGFDSRHAAHRAFAIFGATG